jgi:hypothetical protein
LKIKAEPNVQGCVSGFRFYKRSISNRPIHTVRFRWKGRDGYYVAWALRVVRRAA